MLTVITNLVKPNHFKCIANKIYSSKIFFRDQKPQCFKSSSLH